VYIAPNDFRHRADVPPVSKIRNIETELNRGGSGAGAGADAGDAVVIAATYTGGFNLDLLKQKYTILVNCPHPMYVPNCMTHALPHRKVVYSKQ
jgi:hypothetical protein